MEEVYQKELAEAAEVLKRGGLVAFPTDTVFGVMARMEDEAACRRIYALKGREEKKPLQVLVADLESALGLAELGELRDRFLRLAEAFWPGGLTVVVPGRNIPPWISQDGSVGLRMPDHPWLRELLRRVGGYAAATSLNRSGEPPVRTEAEARAFAVDYVFPGEAGGLASSVVDLRTGEVLREGAIPKEALRPYLRDA
ncbi:MAG: L-threonylcarbamoyladenylate synthase [Thermus sp.]|uniref:L-threonylcarbamoyladenylate synthase n=1 Tax=Thermus sp. TaxID=275 RepID=UPI0025D3A392|nr:L-threonylcarbamoyladenylate synthase [Thermus sp.]MCS7217919.1 L-threonylcarbamoyladenylate synthase [Thermus sp.]MCX7850156.1 L-threonylcarbamoyladenylate synthase [Thermus sp.]MDW8357224.1 L-threonylcarbamoyladenylate synthase [Thermus sp.]